MAKYEIEDTKTGKTFFIDDSLLPEGTNIEPGKNLELSEEDLYKAQIQPVGEELEIDVSAQPQDLEQPQENKPVEYIGNSIRGRGDNWAGGGRNVLQGLLGGAGDEAEALFRRYIYDPKNLGLSYDEYLKNARESYKGYSAEHPERAVAMQIGGALLPTLLTFGATAPASAASTGAMIGRGALSGAGLGALQGFASGEGEDRLANAGQGLATGLALGGVTPAAIKGGQKVLNWAAQIKKGLGESMPRTEAGNRMINLISGANDSYRDNTYLLGMAAMKGDDNIQKAAKDYDLIFRRAKTAESKGYNREVIPEYKSLAENLKTPEMRAADQMYSDFAAQVPAGTNSGMAISSFFKKHPVAERAYYKYGERLPGVKPNTFEGMRDINNVLRRQQKKAQNSGNFALSDDLDDAMYDLSIIRENTTPGIREVDRAWSAAKNNQDVVDDIFFENVKKINSPKELLNTEISATGAIRPVFAPRVRGIGQELLETGKVSQPGTGKLNQVIEKAFSPLQNIGVGKFRIGNVPTTRAGQAIMTDYGLSLENIE